MAFPAILDLGIIVICVSMGLVLFSIWQRRRRVQLQAAAAPAAGSLHSPTACRTGLPKDVRDALPRVCVSYDGAAPASPASDGAQDSQCAICLMDYDKGEEVVRLPPCGHAFHAACIDSWLHTQTTCPICRLSLLPPTAAADGAPGTAHRPSAAVEPDLEAGQAPGGDACVVGLLPLPLLAPSGHSWPTPAVPGHAWPVQGNMGAGACSLPRPVHAMDCAAAGETPGATMLESRSDKPDAVVA
eukprot:SM000072S21194  [mRNA]  locus=s72:196568:197642:- [translate_table: standard]